MDKENQEELESFAFISMAMKQLPSYEPSALTLQKIIVSARTYQPKSFFNRLLNFVFSPPAFSVLGMFLLVTFLLVNQAPMPSVAEISPVQSVKSFSRSAIQERLLANPFSADENPNNFFQKVSVAEKKQFGFKPVSFGNSRSLMGESVDLHMEADADGLMMRGRRLKAMGRMDLALQDFDTLYRFYPEYTYLGDVLIYRAQCYASLGQKDKALESLQVFTEKFPSQIQFVSSFIDELKR